MGNHLSAPGPRVTTSALLLAVLACLSAYSGSGTGPADVTIQPYSWPYRYSAGDPFFVEADAEQARHKYVFREGLWHAQDGLSDQLWLVHVGVAGVRLRPEVSMSEAVTVLQRHAGFTADTSSVARTTRHSCLVRYTEDIDPVRALKDLDAMGLFTVGWLGTYGVYGIQ